MKKTTQKIWRENCAVKAAAFTAEEFLQNPRIKSVGFFFLASLLITLLSLSFSSKCSAEVFVQESEQAADAAPAADTSLENVPMVEKRTEGTVTGANNQGLAVEYASDGQSSKEIWLNYGNEVELRGFQDRSELVMGDVVQVIYDETTDNRRFAKEIVMVQKAPVEQEIPEEPEA